MGNSITKHTEKIKSWATSATGQNVLTIVVIILVSILSFGLGRLSVIDQGSGFSISYKDLASNASISSEKAREFVEMNPSLNQTAKAKQSGFYASKAGKKYYPADCSAGANIKPENKITFSTAGEAESVGYTLSTSCH